MLSKFVKEKAFTIYKTSKSPAVRFDKILLSKAGSALEPVNGFICGNFATPMFAGRNEGPELVEKDDLVRTPSDHLAVVADFKFKNIISN